MIDKVEIGDATLYTGDVLDVLRTLPDESVHCVVTSPPYWGLRDYNVEGMIGLEPTFQDWFDKMVEVCREVRRVLRGDGTFWLNCGDAYAGGGRGGNPEESEHRKQATNAGSLIKPVGLSGFKPKDLLMMPARLAIALQADGWWLRSEIIWAKPNPMPESVTDRPTSAHEKVYLLTKQARYAYDADAVRESHLPVSLERIKHGLKHKHPDNIGVGIPPVDTDEMGERFCHPAGRNLRNVWTIATQPYSEAHFATFPEELPRKCIAAGTSERGVCPKCGAGFVRVVETEIKPTQRIHNGKYDPDTGWAKTGHLPGQKQTTTLGWSASCTCDAGDPVPATVLDIFSGAATTGLVALKMHRRYIGIELNPEYNALALKRISGEAAQVKMF